MGRANLDAVTASIDTLYAAAYDAEQMPRAVEQLRSLFNGSKACFVPQGPNISPTEAISTDFDPAFNVRYVNEFASQMNVFVEAISTVPVGVVYNDHALVGRKRLRESRFWNEWMAPQNMYGGLGCRLLDIDGTSWYFDVQRGRGQRDFDSADVDLFKMIAPTLMRVAELRQRMGGMALKKGVERYALDALTVGVAAVDPQGRVLYANQATQQLFDQPDGPLRCSRGRLVAGDPTCQSRLKKMIVQACLGSGGQGAVRGDLLARSSEPGGGNVALCVMPMDDPGAYGLPDGQPLAMIFARALELDVSLEDEAVRLFGLTPAEAKFASALASGQSLAEAAEAQMVRITTARTHLSRIFQKTGTRQQSQVAVLLRAAHLPVHNKH